MGFWRLLDAIYPRRCVSCSAGGWPFCDACARTLEPIDVVGPDRDPPSEALDLVVSPFRYEGAARRAILSLKFSGARGVVDALAAPMAAALRAAAPSPPPEVVTWVPLGQRRRRDRGFDQARLLARALAPSLGLRAERLLVRTRETGPQARRGAADRRAAMVGAFSADRPAPRSVLLVDDVVTTGATASACAHALREAGARSVVVVAAARAVAPSYTRRGSASGSVVARGASPR